MPPSRRGPPKKQTLSQMQKSAPVKTKLLQMAEPVDKAIRSAGKMVAKSSAMSAAGKAAKVGGELMDSIVEGAGKFMRSQQKQPPPGMTYMRGRLVKSPRK